jgi:hypothetical protein
MMVALNLQAAFNANEASMSEPSDNAEYQMFPMSGYAHVPAAVRTAGRWRRGKSSLSLPRGSSLRGDEGPPACILPHGNRDNDVPVEVAVSTIRKR